MMEITINQLTPIRDDGVITGFNVHFTARTEDRLIHLSGSVPVESFADKIDIEGIQSEVRSELVNRIADGNDDNDNNA